MGAHWDVYLSHKIRASADWPAEKFRETPIFCSVMSPAGRLFLGRDNWPNWYLFRKGGVRVEIVAVSCRFRLVMAVLTAMGAGGGFRRELGHKVMNERERRRVRKIEGLTKD